jgi:hypothetical protein
MSVNRNEANQMGLFQRILWGIKSGATFGLAFTALALLVFLLGGERPFQAHHTSFTNVVVTYLLGGIGSGIIVGVLRPLTRTKAGAGMVGFIAAIPVSVLVRIAIVGYQPWTVKDIILSFSVCLVLGVPVGVMYRDIFRDRVGEHSS